jgi:uncharacterized protein YndB with AHSA1/START domain
MSRSIVKTVTIDAPPDVVWKALTEADELIRWFPVEARVQAGLGGRVWLSWGPGVEGEAPITAWEPNRRFGWTETRGPVKLAIDFHLEASGGPTVVRLVQSGFGDGAEWDDEFHMTEGGWSYFVEHLRWYLERHRGTPRDLVSFREAVPMPRPEAFERLLAALGLPVEGGGRTEAAPVPYETVTPSGDRLSGTVVAASPGTGQLGFTIREIGDAIAFIETEPHPGGSRPAFWLSTYGLGGRLQEVKDRFAALYASAFSSVQR